MKDKFLGPLFIVLCAFLWGSTFVAQKTGADHLGPFAVLVGRSVLAAAFLGVWTKLAKGPGFTRAAWIGGAVSGIVLFLAQLAQQAGMITTSPGIAAFLTSNYILLVPVFGLLCGLRPGWPSWAGVIVALVGSYFICIDPSQGFKIAFGDSLVLLCAALFAIQILCVNHFAKGVDVLAFSCVQQLVCLVLPIPFLFLSSESIHFNAADMKAAFLPLVYMGIVSSGIAYTFQNLGQVRTPPTLAAILMSLESVFGALAGYVVFGDVLTSRQLLGCAIVFIAAVTTPILTQKGSNS